MLSRFTQKDVEELNDPKIQMKIEESACYSLQTSHSDFTDEVFQIL